MPAKVLIADESATIQKVFERSLPPEEFSLSFASTGDEALAKARKERPDLVIADVKISGKDGFALCKTLKQDPNLKGIPVLLLVGILDDFDEDEGRRVGADGFLIKPFETSAALGKVRAVLAKGGGVSSPAMLEEDVLELTDVIEGPSEPEAAAERNREGLGVSTFSSGSAPSPMPPAERGVARPPEIEDIIERSASIPKPSAVSTTKKDETFILESPLRDLEKELLAEFGGGEGKGEVPPFEQEDKGPLKLELDLPFEEGELEPKGKEADWMKLFAEGEKGKGGLELKDERLESILDESATELELIEGKGFKGEKARDDAEEFAERFMDEFEPVFEPEKGLPSIEVRAKRGGELPRGDHEDLAEKVAAALKRELEEAMERLIRERVPRLIREALEEAKKG